MDHFSDRSQLPAEIFKKTQCFLQSPSITSIEALQEASISEKTEITREETASLKSLTCASIRKQSKRTKTRFSTRIADLFSPQQYAHVGKSSTKKCNWWRDLEHENNWFAALEICSYHHPQISFFPPFPPINALVSSIRLFTNLLESYRQSACRSIDSTPVRVYPYFIGNRATFFSPSTHVGVYLEAIDVVTLCSCNARCNLSKGSLFS